MRPFSIFHTHRDQFQQAEKKLLEAIKAIIEPDIVYLLGTTLKRNRTESIFTQTGATVQFLDHFYLLVVIPDSQNRPLHEWQEMIEQSCSKVVETVVIVLTTKQFFEWLEKGHRFARTVEQNAFKIMLNPGLFLPEIGPYDVAAEKKEIAELFARGKYMASEFLAGAEMYIKRESWNLAAFMLHQALEQALSALLVSFTGYEQKTHNIKRMMRYVWLFDQEIRAYSVNCLGLSVCETDRISEIYYCARYCRDLKIGKDFVKEFYLSVSCIIQKCTIHIKLFMI